METQVILPHTFYASETDTDIVLFPEGTTYFEFILNVDSVDKVSNKELGMRIYFSVDGEHWGEQGGATWQFPESGNISISTALPESRMFSNIGVPINYSYVKAKVIPDDSGINLEVALETR